MKLRNRQTGKVYTLSDDLYIEYTQGGRIELRAIIPGGNMSYFYDSLDKLYYEWEDVREPLIKNKKIRKAVRAWAKAINTKEVLYRESFARFDSEQRNSSLDFPCEVSGVKDGTYSITELCGEEEECEN